MRLDPGWGGRLAGCSLFRRVGGSFSVPVGAHKGVMWAPVGPMKALTLHGCSVAMFWAAGWPKKALKKHGALKPCLHIFPMDFDDFHRFVVIRGLAAKEP